MKNIKEQSNHLLNAFKKNGYDDKKKLRKPLGKQKQEGGLLQEKKKEALKYSFLTFK